MVDRFTIFEPVFNNEELEEEFHSFFYKYNLTSLFTNEHRTSGISVTYVDARSVINPGGSYHQTLLQFSDLLSMSMDNQMYEDVVFKILYSARTFQKFMANIRMILNLFQSTDPEHLFNFWNIVYYSKPVF